MKKLIWIFSLLCSLSIVGMESDSEKKKNFPNNFLKQNKNKESYPLIRESFSSLEDINYKGLGEYIHYNFKNKDLLKDALYPLLPAKLGANKLKFEQLELLGDSVLALIIRERLLTLFPDTKRGIIVSLYDLMTQNKTLADVYLRNLKIEKYLPFPDEKDCKICNVVESLIGGIYSDDLKDGLINAKKFVMHILNDHILEEKIKELASEKSITLIPAILPTLEEAIKKVCTVERLISASPKTLLSEILAIWRDQPTYSVSIKKSEGGSPVVSAIVSGAQIGENFQGEGNKRQEAEEEAARLALNFLARKELLPKKKPGTSNIIFSSLFTLPVTF